MSRHDLVGALILGAAFVGLLAAAELWRRLGSPRPEWTRKLVHLGGGIACLFLPFLVDSPWVVLGMALALSGVFALAAKTRLLPSLHGVERASRGAEYYPLAIFLVFFLTQGRPWLYLSAVLVLAVGDAFAALVGGRYGRIRYEVEESEKSLEGSVIFLAIAFLAIHLPMLLMTDLDRTTCVLAALLVAILVTGFEAISLAGADNLFVPLAVVFVLGKITTKPVGEIVFQNLSLVAICLAIALLVWRIPVFNVGAAIAVTLYAYGNWSLGSWEWAVPVLVGVLIYVGASRRLARGRSGPIKVRTVVRALLPLFLILLVANATGTHGRLFGPYLAASAAVLAFSLSHALRRVERRGGLARLPAIALVAALSVAATGLLAWLWRDGVSPLVLVANALVVFAATAGLDAWEARSGAGLPATWTATRFLLTVLAGALVLGLQTAGLIPSWAAG